MKLLPIFIQVAGELGIGSIFFVFVQETGEIRKSFFSFMSWLAAICFFLMALSLGGVRFYASVYFPPAVFALIAGLQFSNERFKIGKGLLLFSAFLALLFLMSRSLNSEAKTTSFHGFAVLNLIAGILLFGWSNGAMILGHWYLVMRGLSFRHFQRATLQLLIVVGIRTIAFAVMGFFAFRAVHLSGASHPVDMLFFTMRLIWGIILPVVFGFMAWWCALSGSNQAGTGLLYIAEVAVLIGEILAGFLGF
jgi:hypothetical protein